jgi:hypothetical protein
LFVGTLSLPPEMYQHLEEVDGDDLQAAVGWLSEQEQSKIRRQASHRGPLEKGSEQLALKLLNSSLLCAGKMWNTEGERTAYRKTMYAMWDVYGVPSIFVTIAPYEIGHPIIVYNAQQWCGNDF